METVESAGHEVRALDLHAEGVDPVVGIEERRSYDEGGPILDPTVARQIDHLRRAEGIVYTTCWYSQPANLRGWFDRVWRTRVAFRLGPQGLRPALTHDQLLGVVATLGSRSEVYL